MTRFSQVYSQFRPELRIRLSGHQMTRFSNAQPGLLLIPARIKDLLLILTRIKDSIIWSSNDQIQPGLLLIPARIKDSLIWSSNDQIQPGLLLIPARIKDSPISYGRI